MAKPRRSGRSPATRKTAAVVEATSTPSRIPLLIRSTPKLSRRALSFPLPAVPQLATSSILPAAFFQVGALELAPRLLGKFIRKDDVVLQITEVEAYLPNDTACHGRFGMTARTAPVFGPGGHAYVYLCYGLHTMLNVVADEEGVGAAVLIRSCAPVSGLETIKERRCQTAIKPILLAGPGKAATFSLSEETALYCMFDQLDENESSVNLPNLVRSISMDVGPEVLVGQALGISTAWSNHPLYTSGGLEILDGPKPDNILVGPRVGIEYALPEHVNAPWRFAVAGSPWISAPKSTLAPP